MSGMAAVVSVPGFNARRTRRRPGFMNRACPFSNMDSPVKHIYDHHGTKKKSEVWKYFGFYKKDQSLPPTKDNLNMEKGVCRVCRKEYRNKGKRLFGITSTGFPQNVKASL